MEDMDVIVEGPAFVLRGGSGWSDEPDTVVEVTWDDLRRAQVGDRWIACNRTNVVRDAQEQEATVVWRDHRGVAVLIRTAWSTDSPNVTWHESVRLVWCEFASGAEPREPWILEEVADTVDE